jgi:hypothetical protein
MDWSPVVIPLVVAIVGVIAVSVGAWVAARSTLRVRLIDMMREDSRDHRNFQIRTVGAVNELGTASSHLIRVRLSYLRAMCEQARTQALASGGPVTISLQNSTEVSAVEEARVADATDAWRSVLAEGHAFASTGAGDALQALDQRRADLVNAVNAATSRVNIDDAIRGLEAANEICNDLRGHFARQVYRHLQIEKVTGSARVFQLAHIRKLRTLTKQISRMQEAQIDEANKLIENADRERRVHG